MMSITKVQSPGFAGKGGGRVVIFLVRKRKAELVVKLPEEEGVVQRKFLCEEEGIQILRISWTLVGSN